MEQAQLINALNKIADEGYEFKLEKYFNSGTKLFSKYAGNFVIFYVIYLVVTNLIGYPFINMSGQYGQLIVSLIFTTLDPALTAGLVLIINDIYRERQFDFGKYPQGFKYFFTLVLLLIVQQVFIALGLMLLVVPGVYLFIAYSFSSMFIIFFDMDIWTALEMSRKIITKRWWNFFALMLILGLINFGGVLLCGVGLIITLPMTLCIMYCTFEDIVGSAIRKYS